MTEAAKLYLIHHMKDKIFLSNIWTNELSDNLLGLPFQCTCFGKNIFSLA